MSPIGLWKTVLKPQVSHYHCYVMEPEVTIFEEEGGAVEDTDCYQ